MFTIIKEEFPGEMGPWDAIQTKDSVYLPTFIMLMWLISTATITKGGARGSIIS